jgi:hypothetical protein
MKSCPECGRTFADDSLTFCMVDGAILSAPYESKETIRNPAPRDTDPAATEILPPSKLPTEAMQSQLSTIHAPAPPRLTAEGNATKPSVKKNRKPALTIGCTVAFASLAAVTAILGLFTFGNRPEVASGVNSRGNNANVGTSVSPPPASPGNPMSTPTPGLEITPKPSATPASTPGVPKWGPRNDQASFNGGERITYYPGSTPEQCQADCDGIPRCTAYTYIRAGFYNPADPPMCYLVSVTGTMVTSPCCISAVKQ